MRRSGQGLEAAIADKVAAEVEMVHRLETRRSGQDFQLGVADRKGKDRQSFQIGGWSLADDQGRMARRTNNPILTLVCSRLSVLGPLQRLAHE
jgi:hypothetical protein